MERVARMEKLEMGKQLRSQHMKIPHEKSSFWWEDGIKICFRGGLDSYSSGQGPMAYFCENCSEHSHSKPKIL